MGKVKDWGIALATFVLTETQYRSDISLDALTDKALEKWPMIESREWLQEQIKAILDNRSHWVSLI